MASDDPFAGYAPPGQKQSADPFAGYSAPKAATPAAPQQGWGDYLAQHVANAWDAATRTGNQTGLAGIGAGAADFGRAIGDAGTFGGSNWLLGQITDRDEGALTQQARQELGPIGSGLADVVGYGIGPGKLKVAGRIGEAVAPALAKLPLTGAGKWLGGVLGSAVEGAGAGALGAAGHGEDIGQGAETGGAFGVLAGVPGGVVGRGGALAPARSADDLRATAKAAYGPLDQAVYKASDVAPYLDAGKAAVSDFSGRKWENASSTSAIFEDISGRPYVTGADIRNAMTELGAASKRGGVEDAQFAPKIKAQLGSLLDSETPYGSAELQPGGGYKLTVGGLTADQVRNARLQGNALHGQAEDVGRLDDWIAGSQVNGGRDVGSQASSWLQSDEGKRFAPPGSASYDAFNRLAGTANPSQFSLAPSMWDFRHALHPLIGGAVGGAIGGLQGGVQSHWDPMRMLEDAGIGLATGYGLHGGGSLIRGAGQRGAQQRAIDAARVAASTGQFQAPVLPDAVTRDAIRTLIYGRAAAGQ